MFRDPIVEEIHKAREEYARKFNYDLWAMFRDLQQRQAAGGREIVDRSSGTKRGAVVETEEAAPIQP